MKVLVTGSSGLIGTALRRRLALQGHDVFRLVRREPTDANEIHWDPESGTIDAALLEGFDGVVHLAGENVGDGRWTRRKMGRIHESRIQGTRLLSETLASLERKPKVLVSASAIGYYGHRGDVVLPEDAPPGDGFLSSVCLDWERAADPARDAGIRVVHPRIGLVLASDGGALARMLLPFRLGLGGRIGSGNQWVSWITLDDQVRVIEHALTDEALDGPVNSVTPTPVRFRDFVRALGKALRRPTIFPMPAPAARLAFGRMADELLLASMRVEPQALDARGFRFQDDEIGAALQRLVGGSRRTFRIQSEQRLQRPLEEVFPFFSDPRNLEALTPPWLHFRIVDAPGEITEGTEIEYRLRIRGFPVTWRSRISQWNPPVGFADEQLVGPYKHWFHVHSFRADGVDTIASDDVVYEVPGGPLAGLVNRWLIRPDLERVFAYRRERLTEILEGPRSPVGAPAAAGLSA